MRLAFLVGGLAVAFAVAGPASATFPGANGKLAWVSTVSGNTDIWVADPPTPLDPDGGEPVNLTSHPASDEAPAWSPDGSRIAFESNRDGDSDVYVVNADGTDLRPLTANTVDDHTPSFSPDGTQLVFSSLRSGNLDIWTMNADGTTPRQLTLAPGEDSLPAWSPDGSTIAFTSNRDGNYEIYVMNADGTGQTNLTRDPGDDMWPSWSPGGAIVLFERYAGGDYEVHAMAADGSRELNLTQSLATLDRQPVLSPDGALLAYATDAPGPAGRELLLTDKFEIHLLALFGALYDALVPVVGPDWANLALLALAAVSSGQLGFRPAGGERSLAAGSAADFSPAWQPLRAGDLAVQIQGPANARRGRSLTYTITAGSLRTGLVEEDVRLAIALPRGVKVAGLASGCTRTGRRVRCALGSLDPWTSKSVTLRLRAPSKPGRATLSVAVTGSLPDPGPAPSSAKARTRIT